MKNTSPKWDKSDPPVSFTKEVKGSTSVNLFLSDRKNVIPSDDLVVSAKQGIYSLFVRTARKSDQGVYR